MYNGHGDVTVLLGASDTILASYYYDAFGNITESTGTYDNPYRYSGYRYDEETKNYYLAARYYNPAIARFLQEDTYQGDPNDPLSLNLYSYCVNNPLVYNDPSGHRPLAAMQETEKEFKESTKYMRENFSYTVTKKATGTKTSTAVKAVESGIKVANATVDFNKGLLSSVIDNMTMGIAGVISEGIGNTYEPDTTAYQIGKIVGDTLTFIAGACLTTQGAMIAGGGVILDVTGVGAVVGVPLNIVGVAEAVYGAGVVVTSGVNLVQDINQISSGGNNGVSGGTGKKLTDGSRMTTNEALDEASDFLGSDYEEVAPGVFRSKDGLRQVRMTDTDITGAHGGGAHMNFETGKSITNPDGRVTFKATDNVHIYLTD